MLDKEKIDRINVLSNWSRSRKLTEEEKEEQITLRKEYIASFRKSLAYQLESIKIVD